MGIIQKYIQARVIVLVHDTSSHCALRMYEVSMKYLKRLSSYRADTFCDGQTDIQADRCVEKNKMSPEPDQGRHNGPHHVKNCF